MFEIIKTFTHESGFEITPFQMEGYGFVFLPKELENQLGYEEELSRLISHSSSFIEGIEYLVLRNHKLSEFKILLNLCHTMTRVPGTFFEGIKHSPSLIVLTEAGLYTIMILSRKPNAEAFRRWITCEVLPSIRKKGFYQTHEMEQKLSTINLDKFQLIERMDNLLHQFVDNLEARSQKDRQALAKYLQEQRQFNQDTLSRLDQIEAVLSDCKNQHDIFGGWKRIKMLVDDMTQIYNLTEEERRRYFYVLCQAHDINLPEKAILATEPLYYDVKEIAHKLGIYSTNGKPHLLLVAAIIRHLKLDQEKYCKKFPFVRRGYKTMVVKYSGTVIESIHEWIKKNGFPERVSVPCGETGKERKFEVKYRAKK